MQCELWLPETLPSESVHVPLDPQVPLPYWAVPELKNMTDVAPPVLAAEPLSDGMKTVVSTGWTEGVAGPLPVVPLGPAGTTSEGAEGSTRDEGSLLQAETARTAHSRAGGRMRCMESTPSTRKGAPTVRRRRPLDNQAVSERPLALRTGLAAGVP